LVTVSVNARSPLIAHVQQAGAFGISVLRRDQENVSRYFATPERSLAPSWLPEVATRTVATGAPIIDGCLSYFDCNLHDMLAGGDHMILVGEVATAGWSMGEPLLYFDGDYRALSDNEAATERAADTLEAAWSLLEPMAQELYEAQAAVEPTLAELTALRCGHEVLGRLERLLDQAAGATADPERFTRLAIDFHQAVADGAGNRPLRAVRLSLRRIEERLYAAHTDAHRAQRVMAAHREIFERIRRHDGPGARQVMAEHVQEMRERVASIQPDRFEASQR